jgi:hypothetical protein
MLTLSRTDQKVVKKAFSRISLREKHLAGNPSNTFTHMLWRFDEEFSSTGRFSHLPATCSVARCERDAERELIRFINL